MAKPHTAVHDRIVRTALRHPESYLESPWGHLVVKVNKKIWAFIDDRPDGLHVGLKLKQSNVHVLEESWAVAMGYGMGKHGWVSMTFGRDHAVPFERVVHWLDESYRNVAPKRLLEGLPQEGVGAAPETAPPEPPEPEVDPDDLAVLLVGNDRYRLDRARRALAREGLSALAVSADDEALDIAGSAEPRLVVLDISKDAEQAMALGGPLGLLTPGQVVICGIRDAKHERKVVGVVGDGPLLSREAPGAPKAVKQLVGLLG